VERIIGLNSEEFLGYLLGFGKVINFAFFQSLRKTDSRKRRLNKHVIRNNVLLEVLEMPSIPQALIKFNELSNFLTSYGLTLS